MRIVLGFIFLAFVCFNIKAQENLNIDLVSTTSILETGNDVWGYVSPEGIEYAIIGSVDATYIYNLSDPVNPRQVVRVEGTYSTWRDMKTWNEHLYVTTDAGGDGLLIVDLTSLEDSIRHKFWRPDLTVGTEISRLRQAHNIYIDENGYAYLAGPNVMSSRDDRGAIILDLNEDPWNPVHVGSQTRAYAHDLFVRNNIMYASELYEGELGIYDVTDKANPVFINSTPTSFDFTHNAWPSDDGNYVFTTDERGNAYVDAFDISDINDIKLIDSYRPLETEGRGVIPHNAHYHNGFLVTSWYTDGIVVVDANKPDNLIKVGSYDTYSGPDGGFEGCWGAYPFLPSGLILASDRSNGLFVLQPKYERACYLEGLVTDIETGLPINGVTVEIIADQLNDGETDATGNYKSGIATDGLYTVRYSHPDYIPEELKVTLEHGVVTIQDVEMTAYTEIPVELSIVDGVTQQNIAGGQVIILDLDQLTSEVFMVDSTGILNLVMQNKDYEIVAGKWGYRYKTNILYNPEDKATLVIELYEGYEDDFVFDYGWTVSGDATKGVWERGIPIGTVGPEGNLYANPNRDLEEDLGSQCFQTGNGGGTAGEDDVDDGITILTSPEILYTGPYSPTLEYSVWFYTASSGGPTNDTLFVKITNGIQTYIIDQYFENTFNWTEPIQIRLEDYPLNYDQPFRVIFEVSDQADSGNLVEAAIDGFEVIPVSLAAEEEEFINSEIRIYPNPIRSRFTVEWENQSFDQLSITDMLGRRVHTQAVQGESANIEISIAPGSYILTLRGNNGQVESSIIIKD
ncbi:MAG: choice-of-anchor B family protein [Bacteroidia bacterium]|nr:choice-of-anchor B family protein [Bacteroidia bacterium]